MSELELPAARQPLWPAVVVTLGLSLTAAWVCVLVYGIVRLVGLAL